MYKEIKNNLFSINASSFNDKQNSLLSEYVKLIISKQKSLNLIGKSTLSDIWSRHILDSAQVLKYIKHKKETGKIIDVGSGAGFPGIVLAIMGLKNLLLCEKSKKKAIFLSTVIEKLKLKTNVFNGKIETYKDKKVDVILSRAYAPLIKIFGSVYHLVSDESTLILHKGKKYKLELDEACKKFNFVLNCYKSITNEEGRILEIRKLKKNDF